MERVITNVVKTIHNSFIYLKSYIFHLVSYCFKHNIQNLVNVQIFIFTLMFEWLWYSNIILVNVQIFIFTLMFQWLWKTNIVIGDVTGRSQSIHCLWVRLDISLPLSDVHYSLALHYEGNLTAPPSSDIAGNSSIFQHQNNNVHSINVHKIPYACGYIGPTMHTTRSSLDMLKDKTKRSGPFAMDYSNFHDKVHSMSVLLSYLVLEWVLQVESKTSALWMNDSLSHPS